MILQIPSQKGEAQEVEVMFLVSMSSLGNLSSKKVRTNQPEPFQHRPVLLGAFHAAVVDQSLQRRSVSSVG